MLVGATAGHEEINHHGLYTDQSNAVSCILNFYGDHDIRGREVSPFAGATPAETSANKNLRLRPSKHASPRCGGTAGTAVY